MALALSETVIGLQDQAQLAASTIV